MIPLWIFLTVTILLAAVIAILAYLHFIANPLPFPDWGNAIFVCPDLKARKALIDALGAIGLRPDKHIKSSFADRAVFFNRFRFIVNVTEEESWVHMGKPVAALAIVVQNPAATASQLCSHLQQYAPFGVARFDNPDSELPCGAMSIVTSSAMPGWAIVLRKHFTKMGPPPPKWHD